MNTCNYTFRSGKKKDQPCGKASEGTFCDSHKTRIINKISSQSRSSITVPPLYEPIRNDTGSIIDSLYAQFCDMSVAISKENRSVIEKKFEYIYTLKPSTNEYNKNFAWLRHALSFPYDKMASIPVSCDTGYIQINTDSTVDIPLSDSTEANSYISDVYQHLDDYVYGLDKVKEEIMAFVCKRIANPCAADHVLALQGGYGVGKCFAKDTMVLLVNGQCKPVQDIVVGDQLMGDDQLPRIVHTLGRGKDILYKITHAKFSYINYTVNKEHILVLLHVPTNTTMEITVENYLQLATSQQSDLVGYTLAIELAEQPTTFCPYIVGRLLSINKNNQEINNTNVQCKCHRLHNNVIDKKTTIEYLFNCQDIPEEYLLNSISVRKLLLQGIIDSNGQEKYSEYSLTIPDRLLTSFIKLCTSIGMAVTCNQTTKLERTCVTIEYMETGQVTSPIKIEPLQPDNYYGFTIDGNERFLLGNYAVVHNTRLAKGLSKALGLPIRTINLGSVNDVSYFTGHGFTYVESEPGRIVQIMNETQSKNCIIYFDELDKIHQTDKGLAINGFLTHLIDPSQSKSFQDVYLAGIELDLSQVFFVFSFNDETLVEKTVRDRLKVIHIQDPSIEEKTNIAEKFIIPEICQNINYQVEFDRKLIKRIVLSQHENHGLRCIKRILEEIIYKLNVIRLLNVDERKRLSYYDDSATVGQLIDQVIRESKSQASDEKYLSMYI